MMTKKLTERKHSIVVAENYEAAYAPLKHLPEEMLRHAVAEFKANAERRGSLPDHIQVIRRLGVIDGMRGYSVEEIARYIDARELAERELKVPSDFVSKGATAVKQSTISKGPRNRKNIDYEDIWDYVNPKLQRNEKWEGILADAVEHFNHKNEGKGFKERKITRAIAWARANPDKISDDS